MKSLGTLIKMHTRELDEMRRLFVQSEEELEKLIDYHNKMEDDLEREHAVASENYEFGEAFINYRNVIKERQKIIRKACRDLEKRIETLKDNIAVKFTEIKRYEILLANHESVERKRQEAIEIRRLDEVAINNFLKENEGK